MAEEPGIVVACGSSLVVRDAAISSRCAAATAAGAQAVRVVPAEGQAPPSAVALRP